MAEEQQFCLRWNNFQVNITSQFEALRDEEDFVDVTLACEGKRLKAHKVVLSACSPYFKDLFKSNPCKHPILFMRDVEFRHLQSLVEFMYAGEVNVAQAQLSSFLRTAESLQIRGLTEAPQRHKQMDGNVQGTTGSSHHTASSPGDNSRANASSPEEEGDDDDVLSLSPPNTPPPAKRQCREQDDANHSQSMHTNQLDSVKSEAPDMVEPKVEAPDYSSDGESKQDGGAMSASFMGLDNSVDMNTSFTGLHGAMEILPGTSTQSFMGETSQDSTQVPVMAGVTVELQQPGQRVRWEQPRPCPVCKRMYSNNSNLRRHMKTAHTVDSEAKHPFGRYKYSLLYPPYQQQQGELANIGDQPPYQGELPNVTIHPLFHQLGMSSDDSGPSFTAAQFKKWGQSVEPPSEPEKDDQFKKWGQSDEPPSEPVKEDQKS